MKIRQIILKGVNNFEDFSYCFEDDWTKTIPGSILLMRPNGSGKSTLLKAISELWMALGTLLEEPDNIVQIDSFSLKAVHPKRYKQIVSAINKFFVDKK
jgi:predicted ATP-binding protein involved in virulence